MPYEIKKSGEDFKVFKKGTSKAFSKSPMTKKEADAQLKALYANTNEGKTNTMKKSELTKMIQEVIKEVLSEQDTNKVNIPLHIEAFAKRKGVLPLVKKVASWAKSCNKIIHGGVAVGKDYGTLVLDLSREDSAIRINLDDQTVELYGKPVRNFNEFKNVFNSQQAEETNESVYHSKKVKIVLSGGDVEEKHDRIISTLKKIDPETTIKYFDATKKIVGTFSNKLVKAINTNLRSSNINDVKVEVK